MYIKTFLITNNSKWTPLHKLAASKYERYLVARNNMHQVAYLMSIEMNIIDDCMRKRRDYYGHIPYTSTTNPSIPRRIKGKFSRCLFTWIAGNGMLQSEKK
jgi:hypothetical protein